MAFGLKLRKVPKDEIKRKVEEAAKILDLEKLLDRKPKEMCIRDRTRDRIYADVTWLDYHFTMIDTGGIEPDSKDIILSQMREQAEIAIATRCV